MPLRRMKLVHGRRSGQLRSKLLEYQSRSLPHRSQVRKVQLFTHCSPKNFTACNFVAKKRPHSIKNTPRTSQLSAPGTSQLSAPGTSQLSAPGTSQLSAPGTSQRSAPGTLQGLVRPRARLCKGLKSEG